MVQQEVMMLKNRLHLVSGLFLMFSLHIVRNGGNSDVFISLSDSRRTDRRMYQRLLPLLSEQGRIYEISLYET